jgi:hypothetical protein
VVVDREGNETGQGGGEREEGKMAREAKENIGTSKAQ